MKIDNHSEVLILKEKDLYFATSNVLTYNISFSKEELKAVNNVKKADDILVSISTYELDFGYVVNISLQGEISIVDDVTSKVVKYKINTTDSLNAALKDDEEIGIDIIANRGNYDFVPVILALFYQSIPLKINFNQKYKKEEDYEIISEEEYNLRKENQKKEDNPFSKLKDLDL